MAISEMRAFLVKQSVFLVSSAMNSQRFSFSSPETAVVFPGPGVSLPSFRKPERLPRIQLSRAFLLAARGRNVPAGELPLKLYGPSACVDVHHFLINDIVLYSDSDSVVVVNVVMNNMENYLPSDVAEQDKER